MLQRDGTTAHALLRQHVPERVSPAFLEADVHTDGIGPMRPGWGPIPMPAGAPIMGGHSG